MLHSQQVAVSWDLSTGMSAGLLERGRTASEYGRGKPAGCGSSMFRCFTHSATLAAQSSAVQSARRLSRRTGLPDARALSRNALSARRRDMCSRWPAEAAASISSRCAAVSGAQRPAFSAATVSSPSQLIPSALAAGRPLPATQKHCIASSSCCGLTHWRCGVSCQCPDSRRLPPSCLLQAAPCTSGSLQQLQRRAAALAVCSAHSSKQRAARRH